MRDEVTMTDRKPYLLRAIYQWIVDNDCTPHLVIAAPGAGWVHGVPLHLLQEEMLVLNISPTATANLSIDNDSVTFNTRFGGQPHQVWVSMQAIVSLIARETVHIRWRRQTVRRQPSEDFEITQLHHRKRLIRAAFLCVSDADARGDRAIHRKPRTRHAAEDSMWCPVRRRTPYEALGAVCNLSPLPGLPRFAGERNSNCKHALARRLLCAPHLLPALWPQVVGGLLYYEDRRLV